MPISVCKMNIQSAIPQSNTQLIFLIILLSSPRHTLHSILSTLCSPPLLLITPLVEKTTILLFSMRICLINPVSSPVMILMMEGVIQMKYHPLVVNCSIGETATIEAGWCEHAHDAYLCAFGVIILLNKCTCYFLLN